MEKEVKDAKEVRVIQYEVKLAALPANSTVVKQILVCENVFMSPEEPCVDTENSYDKNAQAVMVKAMDCVEARVSLVYVDEDGNSSVPRAVELTYADPKAPSVPMEALRVTPWNNGEMVELSDEMSGKEQEARSPQTSAPTATEPPPQGDENPNPKPETTPQPVAEAATDVAADKPYTGENAASQTA